MMRGTFSNLTNRSSLLGPPTRTKSIDANGKPSLEKPRQSLAPSGSRQSLAPKQSLNPNGRMSNVVRQSIAGGDRRASVMGRSDNRRSSAYSNPMNSSIIAQRRDPRDLKDKGYIVLCQKKLVNFLTQNGYPFAISSKILSAPSSKEFYSIFQFLYQRLDSSFKLSDHPQDQITLLFKELHYPVRITKVFFASKSPLWCTILVYVPFIDFSSLVQSTLASLGSPQTWPSLLVALIWLVELIEYDELVKKLQDHKGPVDLDDNADEKMINTVRL